MLELQPKIKNALMWISEILHRLNIPYKIGGGFAAAIYGSERPINDIDISLSGKYFDAILPEVSEYVVAGPKHYQNEKWDCVTLSLNYRGQDIDMTDIDTLMMSNKDQTQWFPAKERRIYPAREIEVNNIKLSIMDPRDLLSYKRELDGEHQLIDIEAVEGFLGKEK